MMNLGRLVEFDFWVVKLVIFRLMLRFLKRFRGDVMEIWRQSSLSIKSG